MENTTKKTTAATSEKATAPNYEKLYNEKCQEYAILENKLAEYDKICKSFAEKANKAQTALQNATLEYNARTTYMLDCVRHAYISIQMALNTQQTQGETQNGN